MDTYAELKSAIQNYAENEDEEFTSEIPTFIEIAEKRILRALDPLGFVCHLSVSVERGDPFITKPPGTLIVKNATYTSESGTKFYLKKKENEYVGVYWPDRTSVGSPKFYAEMDHENIIVAPAFPSKGIFEIEIIARPTALTSTHTSNYNSNFNMNALFYAAMAEACNFMKNYQAAQGWESRFSTEIQLLQNESRRTRRDDRSAPQSPLKTDTLEP